MLDEAVIVSAAGVITGYYHDASFAGHGFVRDRDGTISTFDPPGSTNTVVSGINPAGAITGSYNDTNGLTHGFVLETK